MAVNSSIEWTGSTWNPVTGCTKISAGCKHCYAERMAFRLQLMGQPNYKNGFAVTTHSDALSIPFSWKKPQTIFVNSMSDLFHEAIPTDYILRVFEVMNCVDRHQYQVLTKRHQRLLELDKLLSWRPNIWMGVSVENEANLERVDYLRKSSAHVKFLSIEPLLGPLPGLTLKGIDWVIVGGESGPGSRPIEEEWVKEIRDKCLSARVPFFFKQWGGVNKKKRGRLLDGKIWDQRPQQALRVA